MWFFHKGSNYACTYFLLIPQYSCTCGANICVIAYPSVCVCLCVIACLCVFMCVCVCAH
uniref:Uncharacterized protein n=1 Tax=Anguilla anguilla TaxID=7936 RepID=A0A0E9XY15_ANGAN